MASPRWRALWIGDGFNPRVHADAREASGAYAIRERKSHVVKYVGESSRGTLWKTMLRHFQAPDSFAKVRERGIFTGDPRKYEVAIHVTSQGPRPRAPAAGSKDSVRLRDLKRKGIAHRTDPDQRASAKQADWIATLKPTINVDQGLGPAEEDDFAFGANVPADREWFENPSGLLCRRRGGVRLVVTNPRGQLTEMGSLTRLATSLVVIEWSLRQAPILAYDEAGRLFVVYVGPIVRGSTRAELKEYRRTHWGATARGKVREGGVAVPPFTDRGPALVITYTTKKGGDRELVDYVHKFGREKPHVVEHMCRGGCKAGCAASGAIGLTGGSYSVTERGIVG